MESVEELKSFIAQRYRLHIESIEPGPRGWVGYTYVVHVKSRETYFAKVWRSDSFPSLTPLGLTALRDLRSLGVELISHPYPSVAGAFFERTNSGSMVALFEYIDGAQTASFDAFVVGDLIASIHEKTVQLRVPVGSESFEPAYTDALWQTLERARLKPGPLQTAQNELRTLLQEKWKEIQADWQQFETIARRCRLAQFDMVITHGDVLFNVVRDREGQLYLVDWDELLIAPPERDTWFFSSDPEFRCGYGNRRRSFCENPLARQFYIRNRYFEEVLGFVHAILYDRDDKRRTEALAFLTGDWMRSLRERFTVIP